VPSPNKPRATELTQASTAASAGNARRRIPSCQTVNSELAGCHFRVSRERRCGVCCSKRHRYRPFETFVATELERQASWLEPPLTFWHYREADREVDVIAERPSGEIVGVEVMCAPGTSRDCATCANGLASG